MGSDEKLSIDRVIAAGSAWQWVPTEVTHAMVEAAIARNAGNPGRMPFSELWRAMVDAAPKPSHKPAAWMDIFGNVSTVHYRGFDRPLYATVQERWVPCAERMPDDDRGVLVARKGKEQPEEAFLMAPALGSSAPAFWMLGDAAIQLDEVTHWSELPSLPGAPE